MLTNLQPRVHYHIKILPLFLGCENAPLRGGKNAITGRGNLTAPHRIELTFNQSAETCILSWPSLTLTNQDEEIGYFDIKITEFINSARSNTSNSADVNVTRVEKSTSNYVISNLNPNTDYQVEVGVVPSSPCRGLIPTAWSDPVRGTCVTSPSSPPKIELKLSSTSSPTSRGLVSIILTPVSERNGIISCYFVVVQIGMPKKNNFVEASIDNLAQADEPVDDQPYVAMALERFDEEMEINLGDGSLTCCDVESLEKVDCAASSERRKRRETSTIIRAQNRPLPAETNFTYYAVTSTLSKTGKLYTASPRSGPIVVRPEISADFGYIIAIVVGLIIVIVIIVAIVMYKSFCRRICKKSVRRDTPNCISMQRRTPAQNSDSFSDDDEVIVANPVQLAGPFREFDIQSDNLLKVYLSKRRNDDFIFLEEFQTNLKTLVAEQSLPTTSAKHTENVQKNRFKNIAPIDDARVKLVLLADQPHTDYINASFIDGYSQTAKFIATQGPKENTLNDFWRMVFEQRCKVIVMVTQLREGNKTKCEKYWHDPGEEMAFGNILVRTNNEIFYGDYICRYFSVKCTSSEETLAVTHFQYLSWPDHGIPPTTSSLLRLHRAALHAQMDNKCPLLVHCSAGVGRTGTFIALDILSEQLEREGKVNVFATVYQMRMKRTEMVQSLAQYVYIHKLLTEISMFENTDVDVSAFSQHEACLNVMDHSTRTTGMQIQFNWLNSVPPSFAEMSSARKQVNKNLNLVPGILPYDKNLACLEMTSKDKDVPYINASNISTYNAGCYFIVAQDPVPTNIDIFWRCVVDNCIACIVNLDEDESCVKYWPEINATVTFENIKVKTTGTTQSSYCVERTFEVSKDNMVPRVVKQIELKDWPANGIPPSTNSLLETISVVEKCQTNAQEVKGKKILALVHCRDGSSQAGTFCAISNLVDRLKNENCVDVFRTVKDIRDLRQGAVGNIELYKYCYQAVNEFLASFDLYANFK
ncbi:receptor-type tyrosine-protein phosphatase epsilon-like [Clavelina lepadiformis]|uniref:receptor-type tyrosine-protein phosphatase epsilon-like n=1 Tax=Clavelina lepadiformis TaxID=159417 RepID=UPI0040436943